MCIATGVGQLTAWRNADVKLATGELIASDIFKGGTVNRPTYQTSRNGKFGKVTLGRYTTGRKTGLYVGTHYLQTAQFCYWIMQACSTTENTPAGYNTHAITALNSSTPLNFGIHAQHKLTSQNLCWDLLGCLPEELVISCSETDPIATQRLRVPYAFAQTTSDDLTKTARTEGTTGTIIKNWSHAVAGGLGPAQTALTYNTAVGVAISGVEITLKRKGFFYSADTNHYYTVGEIGDFDYAIKLNVYPTTTDIWDITALEKASYAYDLDLNFKFQADATNDYIQFNFDKLWADPNLDKQMNYDQWTDTYELYLEPLDDTSSLTVTGIDSLDNDHYENP